MWKREKTRNEIGISEIKGGAKGKKKKRKKKKKKKKKGLVSLAGRVGFIAVHAPINCIGGANQGDRGLLHEPIQHTDMTV